MGRTARGVRGRKLAGDDIVVSLDVVDLSTKLLTITVPLICALVKFSSGN